MALAVTDEGRRDILGLWAGDGGEGAKHWMHILTEIKNRGVTDVLMLVCDGLKGLPDAVESVNARISRAVKARGHFPNEQVALKRVYMAIMSLDPTGKGQARWTMRWKTALNAFDGRLSAARQ
ncbi:hypothetical protein GCM10018966_066930 [Streptomyces yanii]